MRFISKEKLRATLLGFKDIILSIVDKKIADAKPDLSTVMDKVTYVSTKDPLSVNSAIKAESADKIAGIENASIFSVYGVDQSGNKGFYEFPVTSNPGGNFSKTLLNVVASNKYYIPLADERKYYDLICQAYTFIPGGQDKLEIIKTFNNSEGYNFLFDKENVSFNGGMQINKIHNIETTTNIDGFFESQPINKADYLVFAEIL